MTREVFLLVESNTTGTGRLFCKAVEAKGLQPVLICSDPQRYPYISEIDLSVLKCDTTNRDAILETILTSFNRGEVRGIYTSSEYWAESAAWLAERLGLPGGDSTAIAACRNKYHQRCTLKAAGLTMPRFIRITSLEDLSMGLSELRPPLIVKPTQGSGSVNVKLCTTESEVHTHVAQILVEKVNERGLPVLHEVLLEDIVTGPEYSVELFSGQVIGITKKHLGQPPSFVEVGHDFPSTDDDTVLNLIAKTAVDACLALRMTWGPVHVEVRASSNGPVVIEVNPRLAGGFIPELVRLATGIDLVSKTVDLASGSETKLEKLWNGYSAIRFLMIGQVSSRASHTRIEELRQQREVVDVAFYDEALKRFEAKGDFRDRVGHVITFAASAASAAEAANMAIEKLSRKLDSCI